MFSSRKSETTSQYANDFHKQLENFEEHDKFGFLSENRMNGYKIVFINMSPYKCKYIEARILYFNAHGDETGGCFIRTHFQTPENLSTTFNELKNIGTQEIDGLESLIAKLRSGEHKDYITRKGLKQMGAYIKNIYSAHQDSLSQEEPQSLIGHASKIKKSNKEWPGELIIDQVKAHHQPLDAQPTAVKQKQAKLSEINMFSGNTPPSTQATLNNSDDRFLVRCNIL